MINNERVIKDIYLGDDNTWIITTKRWYSSVNNQITRSVYNYSCTRVSVRNALKSEDNKSVYDKRN